MTIGRILRFSACLTSFLAVALCNRALFAGEENASQPAKALQSPLSPEDSLKHFRLAPGCRIEVVAAEPEVVDPVSIAFDAEGRMYVVEMRDYPTGAPEGQPPLSQIRLLEDRDHDGRYETAHVFAKELLFPTGVLPWKGGVIVTLAGEIAYFKDTDGDHQADVRETWFTGFAQENTQLRANHPTLGIDNRVYVANGLRGGTIVPNEQKWGRKLPEVSLSGKDFRFDPHTGECEAVAGNGQFGMSFDDFGNRFICDNRHPCRQVMLEDRYTRRNKFLAVRDVVQDILPAGEQSRIYPLSRAWTTSTQHTGQFTAACGVLIYRDQQLPESLTRGAEGGDSSGQRPEPLTSQTSACVFVCEPTANLVHWSPLRSFDQLQKPEANQPSGMEAEFLATADEWFRPVDLQHGPDGALYIVDMYRAVIEHPEWVPDELKNRPDTWLGNDRGRIYRVVRSDRPSPQSAANLASRSTAELVRTLVAPNIWRRETAARLLLERQDPNATPALRDLVSRFDRPHAGGIVQALWLLESAGALDDELLQSILCRTSDKGQALPPGFDPIYQQALILSEPRLARWKNAAELIGLPDLRLSRAALYQLVLSAGALPPNETNNPNVVTKARLLANAAQNFADNEWFRRALLTADEDTAALLAELLQSGRRETLRLPGRAELVRECAEVIGAQLDPTRIGSTLELLVPLIKKPVDNVAEADLSRVVFAGWAGLGQGMARRGVSLAEMIARIANNNADNNAEVGLSLEPLYFEAVRQMASADLPLEQRLEALAAVQFAPYVIVSDPLFKLAKDEPRQPLRIRAIEVLASFSDPQIATELLAEFSAQTPPVRRVVLQALLRDSGRILKLLDAIAGEQFAPTELDPLSVQLLMNHKDAGVREAAQKQLASLLPADRKSVLEQYQPALTSKADAKRGKPLFAKHCAACHKIGDVGIDVAPDIADSRTKTPAQLLGDILNPNGAIDNNYVSYTAVTRDGKTHTGVISTETSVSITLKQPEGKLVQLLRTDIEELRSSGVSLMPEGLEKNITVAEMADLIAFIKNWRYLDGAVPVGGETKGTGSR